MTLSEYVLNEIRKSKGNLNRRIRIKQSTITKLSNAMDELEKISDIYYDGGCGVSVDASTLKTAIVLWAYEFDYNTSSNSIGHMIDIFDTFLIDYDRDMLKITLALGEVFELL